MMIMILTITQFTYIMKILVYRGFPGVYQKVRNASDSSYVSYGMELGSYGTDWDIKLRMFSNNVGIGDRKISDN